MRPLLIASLAALALAGCSQPAAKSGSGDRRGQDGNGDGKVTLEEAKASQARMFAHYDANHDGKLSFEEIEAMPERMAGRVDRMDVNGDREVSADEMARSAETRFHRRDKNADGVLSPDELRAGRGRRANGERTSEPV